MNARHLEGQTYSEDRTGHHASPQPVLEAVYGFAVTRALATAVELEIFTRVARDRATLDALCHDTGCPAGALSMLLAVLSAMGFLETSAGSYHLTAVSAAYLDKASSRYIGNYVSVITASSWSAWGQLSETVRSGRPAKPLQGDQSDAAFFAELVPALHALTFQTPRVLRRPRCSPQNQRGRGMCSTSVRVRPCGASPSPGRIAKPL